MMFAAVTKIAFAVTIKVNVPVLDSVPDLDINRTILIAINTIFIE